jgi:CHU_C Type IX secretion signal domain
VSLAAGETRTFHYSTQEVCDSVITITVVAYPSMTFNPQALKSCPNTDNGTISVANVAGGTPPFEWSLDGTTFQAVSEWTSLAPGNYVVVAQDQNDCLFEQPVTVEASLPLDVILPEALLPCDAAAVVLSPVVGGNTIGGVQFKWHNGSTEPQIQCTATGPVWVEVTNLCETVHRSSEVNWADAGKWDQVYVPNIFGEKQENEQNSVFRPFFVAGVEVSNYHLEIFDRWGNLTFTSDNPDQAWDGPMVDQMMQGAVFVWQLTADLSFCGRKISVVHVGDVTLLR